MKKQAYTALAMITLIGLMVVTTNAQTSGRATLVANIPFEFNVAEKVMPPGDYTVVHLNPSSDRAVLQLRSKDGGNSAMIQMLIVTSKATDHARLVFGRYGNKYFFAEAWVDGEGNGLRASKSRSERVAATEMGVTPMKTQTIALRTR